MLFDASLIYSVGKYEALFKSIISVQPCGSAKWGNAL